MSRRGGVCDLGGGALAENLGLDVAPHRIPFARATLEIVVLIARQLIPPPRMPLYAAPLASCSELLFVYANFTPLLQKTPSSISTRCVFTMANSGPGSSLQTRVIRTMQSSPTQCPIRYFSSCSPCVSTPESCR